MAVLLLAFVPGVLSDGALLAIGDSRVAPEYVSARPTLPAEPPHGPAAVHPRRGRGKHHATRHHGANRGHHPGAQRPPHPGTKKRRALAPAVVRARAAPTNGSSPAVPGVQKNLRPRTPAPVPVAPGLSGSLTPEWLDVQINGHGAGVTLLLRDADGRLWARREDLVAWRLPLPAAEPVIYNGEPYYPLAALPGLDVRIDEAAQVVILTAPAKLFPVTAVTDRNSYAAVPDPARPGGFFNYDVIAARAVGGSESTAVNGLFELGAFNRFGVVTSTAVRSSQADNPGLVRLDTTFTQDRPQALASLRLGDSISGISSWGGAVHFGGVQWSTDFTTQPGFVTTPLAGIRGEAVLPSTLDLYLNDALRLQTTIPPGPFTINDLPVNSGQGEARVVVRNMLGQEQTISVPYFVSPLLLRAGLSSFSYEVGAARDNYGLVSNDYGRGLAVATDRYGFSNSFTGEVHAELLADQQTAGLGGVWLAGRAGVVSTALAASHSPHGDGVLGQLGFQRQWEAFGFGASVRMASASFVELGMLPTDLPPVRVVQAYLSVPMPQRGSLSLNYTQEDYRTAAPEHLLSMQASWAVGRRGFLGLTALKPLRGGSGPYIGLNFTLATGPRTNVTTSIVHQNGGTEGEFQMQQNLPAGTGFGYRVSADDGISSRADGTVQYQNDAGSYALQVSRTGGQTNTSFEAQGGVALFNDRLYLSRRLDESFAVVSVGDFSHVHIYADNQVVAETDASGTALVPRIRPYERNALRIDPADLPLDVDIDTLEKEAVPFRRSAVGVDFGLHRSQGALMTLVGLDGLPIPAGAVATLEGGTTEFPVGTKGEVYVTGLTKLSLIHVSWRGNDCESQVEFTPSADPLPKIGPLLCALGKP